MKRTFLPCLLLLSGIMLSSGTCSKKDSIPQVLLEHYPQYWIITIDESPTEYTFLKTNGATMYRDKVQKSYSLVQLADDENCKFEVSQSRSEYGSKDCFVLRLDKNKKLVMGVAQSTNKQEWHLVAGNTTSTDLSDNYKFFVHRMPDENGVKTVTLESVEKPGWYISSSPPGSSYAAIQVTLKEASSPEKATHWQCR